MDRLPRHDQKKDVDNSVKPQTNKQTKLLIAYEMMARVITIEHRQYIVQQTLYHIFSLKIKQ